MGVLEQDPLAMLTHHNVNAQRVSDAIDDALKAEKKKRDKAEKGVVKVLLLGQSESGKSTTLKNLRLAYDPEGWARERASWRSVVQLNVIRSVHTLLPHAQDNVLKLRLTPLRSVEADLMRRFGASATEATPSDASDVKAKEVSIRAMSSLPSADDSEAQAILAACRNDIKSLYTAIKAKHAASESSDSALDAIGIEESSGFFLNESDRVCAPDYMPSDDDVVRARLRTTGVQECRICFNTTNNHHINLQPDYGREWIVYDVGGCRTQRNAWLPYFENINAIIFLAPLSPFDLNLSEDSNTSRLDDTMRLWHYIVGSKLLSRTTLITFLNKCDLLKRKLRRDVKFADFVPSYTGENEVAPVVKWMRDKFKDVAVTHTPSGAARAVYLYPTSVTDTKATSVTLRTVHDGILREHLKNAELV